MVIASLLDMFDNRLKALDALSRSCLASVSAGDSEAFVAALDALSRFCLFNLSAGDSDALFAALSVLSRFCLYQVFQLAIQMLS